MTAGHKQDLASLKIMPIQSKDCVKSFNCAEREIDRWAKDKAWKFNERGRARVFVARTDNLKTQRSALGFYSLSFSTENSAKLISADDRDAWKDGAPLVYVDYIAVQKFAQGQSIGSMMLIDALKRAYFVSQNVAFFGVALRSMNDRTTRLYQRFGFGIAPDEDSHPLMILPIWSVRDLFEKGSSS